MKYVLFVCAHNAGRSQIARAFFERYAPEGFRAESAPCHVDAAAGRSSAEVR
jgi:protein-tyrosine-phosphatase